MLGEIVNTLETTTYVHFSTRLTILQPHRKVDDNKRHFSIIRRIGPVHLSSTRRSSR
jgi:hypothetical protein